MGITELIFRGTKQALVTWDYTDEWKLIPWCMNGRELLNHFFILNESVKGKSVKKSNAD